MRKPLVVSLMSDDLESLTAICQDSECEASEAIEMFLHDLFNGQIVLVKDNEGLSLYYQPQLDSLETTYALEKATEENTQLLSRINSLQSNLDTALARLLEEQVSKAKLEQQIDNYADQIVSLTEKHSAVDVELKQKTVLLEQNAIALANLSNERTQQEDSNVQLRQRLLDLETELDVQKQLVVKLQQEQVTVQTIEVIPPQTLECQKALSQALLDMMEAQGISELPVVGEAKTVDSGISPSISPTPEPVQQVVESQPQLLTEPEPEPEPEVVEPIRVKRVATTECYAELPSWLQPESEVELEPDPKEQYPGVPPYICAEDEIRATVDITPTLDREVLEKRFEQMRAIHAKWETPEEQADLEDRIRKGERYLHEKRRKIEAGHTNNPPSREQLLEKAIALAKEAEAKGLPKIPQVERYKTIKEVFGASARPSTPEDEEMLLRAWGEAELSKPAMEAANALERTKVQTWHITRELEVQISREDMANWLSEAPENSLVRTCVAVLEEMNQKAEGKNKALLELKERSQQLLLAMLYDNVKPTEDDLNLILEYLAPTIRNLVSQWVPNK